MVCASHEKNIFIYFCCFERFWLVGYLYHFSLEILLYFKVCCNHTIMIPGSKIIRAYITSFFKQWAIYQEIAVLLHSYGPFLANRSRQRFCAKKHPSCINGWKLSTRHFVNWKRQIFIQVPRYGCWCIPKSHKIRTRINLNNEKNYTIFHVQSNTMCAMCAFVDFQFQKLLLLRSVTPRLSVCLSLYIYINIYIYIYIYTYIFFIYIIYNIYKPWSLLRWRWH